MNSPYLVERILELLASLHCSNKGKQSFSYIIYEYTALGHLCTHTGPAGPT